MTIFEGKSMETKYSVLCYFINLYFCNYRLAIKIEECSHCDRSDEDQIKIQNTIEKQLGCKFIRINPDKKVFHMNQVITEIIVTILYLGETRFNNNFLRCQNMHTYYLICNKHTDNLNAKKDKIQKKIIRQTPRCDKCVTKNSLFIKKHIK